jgi:hypothetical protein
MNEHMTKEERETWLITFATRDLDDEVIPEYERKELIRQFWDFGHHKRSSPLPTGGTITRASTGGLSKCTWKDVLEANYRALHAVLGLLDKKRTPKWKTQSVELSVEGVGAGTGDGVLSHGDLYQETRNALDAFTFEMCQILVRLAGKITRCTALKPIPPSVASKPDEHPQHRCNKVFLRSRKDKRFCSDPCRIREAMRKNRKRKKEFTGLD